MEVIWAINLGNRLVQRKPDFPKSNSGSRTFQVRCIYLLKQIEMRITKENTIGLIIDIQERLFQAMWQKELLLKNTLILIQGLNELKLPLLVTQQYTNGLGETIPEIKAEIDEFGFIEKRN